MSSYTEHTAGLLLNGLQRCTRCGATLVDYRGGRMIDSDQMLRGFDPGTLVYVRGGVATTMCPINVTINVCKS